MKAGEEKDTLDKAIQAYVPVGSIDKEFHEEALKYINNEKADEFIALVESDNLK